MGEPKGPDRNAASDDEVQARLRELESIGIAPTDASDPRLAIPELLKRPARGHGPATKVQGEGLAAGLAGAGKAWAIAFEFITTVIGAGVLGWLVDRWRGSSPVGALVGLALGFGVAFVRIVRTTQAQERAERARANRPKGER